MTDRLLSPSHPPDPTINGSEEFSPVFSAIATNEIKVKKYSKKMIHL